MKTIKLNLENLNNSNSFNVDGTINSTSTSSRFKGNILENGVKFGYINTSFSVNFDEFPKENQEVLDKYTNWIKEQYELFNKQLATNFSEMKEKADTTL